MQVAGLSAFLTVLTTSVLAGAVIAPPANAGHGNTHLLPDNNIHEVDQHHLVPGSETSVSRGIAQLDRTQLDATLAGSDDDVDVYDAYYGTSGEWNDVAGRARCIALDDPFHCAQWRVNFNLSYTAGWGSARLKSNGCHEFGHTAGLGHRTSQDDSYNNSCMRTPSLERQSLDTHDIDAVNYWI